jgi:hypothetical protein
MSRILPYVQLTLIWIGAVCAMAGCARPTAPVPVVVLEATEIHHGMGQEAERLLVRLTEDGKIEWDEWKAFPASEHHNGSVSANVVSEVQHALNTVDPSLFRSQLGPYYAYIDTSDELRVRMKTKTGPVEFRLINPWSSGITAMPQKPMPTDVRIVFCEIDALYAKNANHAVDETCKTNDSPR